MEAIAERGHWISTYGKGILEITVPLKAAEATAKQITIAKPE